MSRRFASSLVKASLLFGVAALAVTLLAAARDTSAGRALAAPAAQQPFTNDNFAAPGLVLGPPSPPGASILPWDGAQTTVGATLEPGESAPCAPIGATVWFYYQPDHPGTLEVSTAGSDFDTVLAVYTIGGGFLPSPPGGNLVNVACNDDAPGGVTSLASVSLTPYTGYYIQAGGKDGAAGDLRLQLRCNPACPPSNDSITNATRVWVDAYAPQQIWRVDTRTATLDPEEPRPCGNVGATVWFSLYADQDVDIVADTRGSNFDTVLASYGPPARLFPSPPGGVDLLSCNDDAPGSGTASRIELRARANTTYWFQAGGKAGVTGDLVFNIGCKPACPPTNNAFERAPYANPPFEEDTSTVAATVQPGEPTACGDAGNTVWYALTTFGRATVVVDTAGSGFDTTIAAFKPGPDFDGTPSTLESLACDPGGPGRRARVQFQADPFTSFFVQAGGRSGASGNLRISINCDPACPPNGDVIGGARFINVPFSLPTDDAFDTRGATVDPGEPTACGNIGRTVWYQLNSTVRTTLLLDAAASNFPVAIAAYNDYPSGAQPVACATDGRLPLPVEPGDTWFVQVGGIDGAGGDLRVRTACDPECPPANDNSAYASDIYGGITDVRTVAATLEQGEPQPCGEIGATVWYRFGTGQDARVRITADGSGFPTVLAAYRIDGFSPPGALAPIGCADPAAGSTLEFDATANTTYYIQAGGVAGASGNLRLTLDCGGCSSGGVVGIPAGPGPIPVTGGGISLPNTGNGGYLPGARR